MTAGDSNFAESVLSWSDSNPRSLPWRVSGTQERRDPWSVLVVETMLAQTQAHRVAQVYPSFLERFPTAVVMAEASKSEVLERWIGLGYYRRAVRLWECSTIVSSEYPNSFPTTEGELLRLPGVGRYTAAAILAFSFAVPVVPVDTNALRVARRALAGRTLTRTEAQQTLDCVVPPDRPAAFAEALFDLGSMYCVAKNPRCSHCPLRGQSCVWQLELRSRRSEGGGVIEHDLPYDPVQDPASNGTEQLRSSPYQGSRRHLRALILRNLLRNRDPRSVETLREEVVAVLVSLGSQDRSGGLSKVVTQVEVVQRFDEALRDLLQEGFIRDGKDGLQLTT